MHHRPVMLYLMSYIADGCYYPFLRYFVPNVPDRMSYFLPSVLWIGSISLLMSQLINWVYKLIEWIVKLIIKTTRKPCNQQEPVITK